MKRLFLALIMALSFSVNAQTLSPAYGSNTSALFDTLSDASTVYFTTVARALNANKTGAYSVTFKATNISGTSTFKVILQGTLDGTNWTNIHQVAGTDGIHCDTLQVTSLSPANWIFRIMPGSAHSVTSSTYLYTNAGKFARIRLKIVGTGTQKTRITDVYVVND